MGSDFGSLLDVGAFLDRGSLGPSKWAGDGDEKRDKAWFTTYFFSKVTWDIGRKKNALLVNWLFHSHFSYIFPVVREEMILKLTTQDGLQV